MPVDSLARRRVAGDPATPAETASRRWVQNFMGAVNVLDYGATGDGSTDDTVAIQAAITDVANLGGGVVIFSRGTYRTSAPLEQPENVELLGNTPGRIIYDGTAGLPCVIRPLASHAGPSVIRMRGKADTGRTYDHVNARVRRIAIDGTAAPSGIKGIALYGLVREAVIEDVGIYKITDASFWAGQGTASGIMPQSLRFFRCVSHKSGGAGFSFSNVPDSILDDCLAIGGAWVGFYLSGFIHGVLNNCKSEWNSQHGVYLTGGYWGTGTGAGGIAITNLQTDRNGSNGLYIDSTGVGPIQVTSPTFRRDGRNNGAGGGGYAGLFVSTAATTPVTVDNIAVLPGVDDDGTQTASPQIGVSSTGSNLVTVTSGSVHAITTAVSVGTGTMLDPTIILTTGTTAAPVRVPPPVMEAPLHPSDALRYGAVAGSMARRSAPAGAPIPTGVIVYSGTIAMRAAAATKLRMAINTVGANTNSGTTTATLQVTLFVGTGANAALTGTLTQFATFTLSGIQTAGLKEFTLPSTLTLKPGDYLFFAILPVNYTTNPNIYGVNAPAAGVTAGKWASYSAGGQTAIPNTVVPNNVATAWTSDLWWELAA